jgi:hypothetical protein
VIGEAPAGEVPPASPRRIAERRRRIGDAAAIVIDDARSASAKLRGCMADFDRARHAGSDRNDRGSRRDHGTDTRGHR